MLKRFLKFVKAFVLPHLRWVILAVITGLVASAASGMGVPFMIKYVFPVVFMGQGEGEPEFVKFLPFLREVSPTTLLLVACMFMPFIFLVRGVAMWLNSVMVNYLGIRILEQLRMSVFCRVQTLPIAFIERRQKGDVISRILADTQNVQNILSHVANDLIRQPFTCLCAMCAFIYVLVDKGQGAMFYVSLVFFALAAWPVYVFGRRISRKAFRAQENLGELNSVLQQNLETQREVRAYAMEERQIAMFDDVSRGYCRNTLKLVKYQKALVPVMETVTAIALAFLLVCGRMCDMNLTDFMTLAAALFFAFDSMKRAGMAFNRLNEAQGSLIRLAEVLDEPMSISDPETPQELPAKVKGDIDFENVSFSYDGDRTVLRDVNIHIPAGQIVGLVGPSGAGKTTFASLIPRFYDISSGCVKVDGIDIREVRQHDLREQMSLVGQHALLFAGTIEENIRLGRQDATDEEVWQAAESASVTKFLNSQKNGIKTVLGQGGSGLSGGQRQRVAIARAFVKDAPILILDEATASLDAESEREIQEELDVLAKGRTTLIVAHRFSTLRNADRILVFDAGRIIGDGPHDQLYATCPLYKELYDRQGIE